MLSCPTHPGANSPYTFTCSPALTGTKVRLEKPSGATGGYFTVSEVIVNGIPGGNTPHCTAFAVQPRRAAPGHTTPRHATQEALLHQQILFLAGQPVWTRSVGQATPATRATSQTDSPTGPATHRQGHATEMGTTGIRVDCLGGSKSISEALTLSRPS